MSTPFATVFPDQAKKGAGVAILRPEHYDDWLSSTTPEVGRVLIEPRSAAELRVFAAPKQASDDDVEDAEGPPAEPQSEPQASLF